MAALFKAYDYQRRAIDWVLDHRRCGLFLDMGLGKSVITLTAIAELLDACELDRVLVVAPKKVAESTWTDEASKWKHLSALRVVKVLGSPAQRRSALAADGDVYVIGRDNFVWLFDECGGRLPFDMIVLDELTSFKTPSSKRFKAMRRATATAARVVGLTGTPAPNGLLDLWAQIYCIDVGQRLGHSVTRYRDTYFSTFMRGNVPIRCTLRPGSADAIRGKIADICLSMQAADYLTLPPMMVHDVRIDLPAPLMEQYHSFAAEKVLELTEGNDGDDTVITAAGAAAVVNKLSQFANGAVYDSDSTVHAIHSEKVERLEEIVESAGEPVLVFYQYRHDIDRITAALGKDKSRRIRLYKDSADLEAWNAGEVDVLLAHPASTAYGLNMQHGGRYIVWFGIGWDLELYQQANARLYRQGQQKPVVVYRLIAAGTVDERAAASLEGKKNVQQELMDTLGALISQYSRK